MIVFMFHDIIGTRLYQGISTEGRFVIMPDIDIRNDPFPCHFLQTTIVMMFTPEQVADPSFQSYLTESLSPAERLLMGNSLRYPAFLILYGFFMPAVISILVNYLVISKKLNRTPLSLIRNEQRATGISRHKHHFRGFYSAFQFRQLSKEKRSVLAVVMGLFISMIIFMIGLDCYILCEHVKEENIEDTKYRTPMITQ